MGPMFDGGSVATGTKLLERTYALASMPKTYRTSVAESPRSFDA